MTVSVGSYTFASWLRRGIGNRIAQTDRLGGALSGIAERATVPIDVTLNETALTKSFALLGPGDVIGVNPQMIVRTEPLNWITDLEPNYLAFVEFYDEDFLWRYTPARPNGDKLSPWLALLVLKAPADGIPGEFELVNRHDPLRALRVTVPAALPPLSRNWAMGHVHVNEGHANATDFERFILSLEETGAPNADKIISRLFSARKLAPDTAYRAFLVPAFETGRLAGLGQDPAAVDSQALAWTGSGAVELPIYFDWYFRTGQDEDFESLVKRLEPRPVDRRVGIRDMDGSVPDFGVATGTDIGAIPPHGSPQSIIGLEGALRAPDTVSRPAAIDPAMPFFADLAAVLNLNDDRKKANPGSQDPVVTPPIYGGAHARRERVDMAASGWLTGLNRDPRLRVSAGLGTRVVQTHQETYVARAWSQVTAILDANRRMILARLAMATAKTMQATFFAKLPAAMLLAVARPVAKKVKGSPFTIHPLIGESRIAGAPLDAAMRRLVRPRGPVARRLVAADPDFSQDRLVEDINAGHVTAAPPKTMPEGLPADDALATGTKGSVPAWLRWLARFFWWIVLLLLIGAGFALIAGWWTAALAIAFAAVALVVAVRRGTRRLAVADGFADPVLLAVQLGDVGARPGFQLIETDPPPRTPPASGTGSVAPGRPSALPQGATATLGSYATPAGVGTDTVEAANFRRAAIALAGRFAIKPVEPPRVAMDLGDAAGKLAAAMNPERAWPRLVAREVIFAFAPTWLLDPEHLVPALAYPDFDDPMYEKLRDLSAELFLPNIKLIEPDTITLLKTNTAFIESYMVGLNHEFGRELLWREYPTDQRCSSFRQFWSVRGLVVPKPALTPEEVKAMYRDIVPIDTWPSASNLGTHKPPQRPQSGDLVLTVRGELLKKYPNTLIYAQKAHMARNASGALDASLKPVIRTIATSAEMDAEIRFPIFSAEVPPDIRFFGFDLTIAQAKGADDPRADGDDWGWYFLIQELPGEPRFGMDIEFDPDDDNATPITWNDLSWSKMPAAGGFVDPAAPPTPSFFNLLAADLKAQWGRHSADMASILFQRPVMIAVHAREMLEKLHA